MFYNTPEEVERLIQSVASIRRRMGYGEDVYKRQRQAHEEDFRILQFNAVVAFNVHARHLYERIGFHQLGIIPGGFLLKDGTYEDICPYYIEV